MCYCNLLGFALVGLLSLDCMAIVTLASAVYNLQIDIAAKNSKKCVNALIYNSFMALYGYIKNDITDGSVKGVGRGWACGGGLEWIGMGVEWVPSLYRDKMSI